MAIFTNPWIKYWIRRDPFFTEALEIINLNPDEYEPENRKSVVSLFVGRKQETDYIINLIRRGGGTRFLVIGDSGVGKTTTVNYVRNLAKKENYITPLREISVNTNLIPYRLMIETLVLLYDELKSMEDLKLSESLVKRLSHLEPFIDLNKYDADFDPIISNTPTKLISLFKELTAELRGFGYPPVIIHYNNFDMVKDEEKLIAFLNDMREFFDNDHAIIILLGNNLLDYCVSSEARLRQKYQQSVYIGKLSTTEIKDILNRRIEALRIDESKQIELYEDEVINTLYKLFNGNVREILNSLSFAFEKLSNSNFPIKLTTEMMRDILSKGVYDNYLIKLTPLQKKILKKMMEFDVFTGAQIAKETNRPQQNFSQSFIPKFIALSIITLKEIKGREKYYQVCPKIYWWNLERTENEKKKNRTEEEEKLKEAQKQLKDF